jgi:hypothetical protein
MTVAAPAARCVLADPSIATDADYAEIEAVVGHEYFHNWTGNRVTCRDWFQVFLKQVARLDALNPIVAAHPARALDRWSMRKDISGVHACHH